MKIKILKRKNQIELELNLLDWNVKELEHELELEDMKPTIMPMLLLKIIQSIVA